MKSRCPHIQSLVSPLWVLMFCLINAQAQIPREPGQWKRIMINPGVGRTHHMVYDPNDGDSLYINPDGDGIWYTGDLGKHWECVTDNIPVTADRVAHKNIMVDPDHFETLFYLAETGAYYITEDRGKHWTRVTDDGKPVVLPLFRRGIVATAKDGTLVMAATVNRKAPKGGLFISTDRGVTWKHHPSPSSKEFFYEIAFEPGNPDVIYAPTQRHLYKSVDRGETFKIIHAYTGTGGGFSHIDVSERDPKTLWLNTTDGRTSGLYRSEDGGETWTTIQDMAKKIGWDQQIWFRGANDWIHCFAVNPNNHQQMMTGAVGVYESLDGGKTWVRSTNRANGGKGRPMARVPDGSIVSHPYGHHLADNHRIAFHPKYKNRVYRCCDTGFYVRDPEIGLDSWTSITGEAGSFLMRNVAVNEFDDHFMIGNSQDLGVETFQYGSWWGARGYEGNSAIIYPFSNLSYYPFGGRDGEIMDLEEPGKGRNVRAWGRPSVAVNYRMPDEGLLVFQAKDANGRKTERRVFKTTDRLFSVTYLPMDGKADVLAASISRTPDQRYTAFSDKTIFQSSDHGASWKSLGDLPGRATFGASDPNNPDRLWICTAAGQVFRTRDNGQSWEDISDAMFAGESGVQIVYHEGTSEDLYLLTKSGLYYRGSDKNTWRRWLDGFALPSFGEIVIDYQRQKMLGSHFGRGAYEADLEQTRERFIHESPAIAVRSRQDDRVVFELDTPLFLPEYYRYQWTVNNKAAGGNSRFFHGFELKAGDTIQCILSPKSFPATHISSRKIQVASGAPSRDSSSPQRVLTSASGQVRLGHFDYFGARQDVTLAFDLKAQSDGVVLANRWSRDHDAKGLLIMIEGEDLVVKYGAQFAKRQVVDDVGGAGDVVSSEKLRTPYKKGVWNHVQLVIKRGSHLNLSINGKSVARAQLDASEAQYSFNGVFDLCLFADARGQQALKGAIDELKIWATAVEGKQTEESLSRAERLHYGFNVASPNEVKERYTGKAIRVQGDVQLGPAK